MTSLSERLREKADEYRKMATKSLESCDARAPMWQSRAYGYEAAAEMAEHYEKGLTIEWWEDTWCDHHKALKSQKICDHTNNPHTYKPVIVRTYDPAKREESTALNLELPPIPVKEMLNP